MNSTDKLNTICTGMIVAAFMFTVFTIRSCVTENAKIDLEKLKYPHSVTRSGTQTIEVKVEPRQQNP